MDNAQTGPGTLASPWDWRLPSACLLALGLALRLYVSTQASWYWDEGYLAEGALSLAQGEAPRSGALWLNGLAPLPCSLAVPASAAPLAALPLSALQAVRLWAVLLAGFSGLAMVLIARRCLGRAEALWAALLWSLWPLAVHYQSLAFYHPLGVALMLASVWAATCERPFGAAFLAGAAVPACYWMWWFPPLMAAALIRSRRESWLPVLVLAGALPLAAGLGLWLDPHAVLGELKRMHELEGAMGPQSPAEGLRDLWLNVCAFPALAVGLAGAFLAWRQKLPWAGLLLILTLASTVLVSFQRGDLTQFHYLLLVALPLVCLGAAHLAARLSSFRPVSLAALFLILAAFAWPSDESGLQAYSVEPAKARELAAFLKLLPQGSQVLGMEEVDWALRPELKAYEPEEGAAALGLAAGYLPAHLNSACFAFQPRLEDTWALVTSPIHPLALFRQPFVALLYLRAEMGGWPLAFHNGAFKVYLNPKLRSSRFHAAPDPGTRILDDPGFYVTARQEALEAGDPAAARFAEQRAQGH